MAKLVGKIFFSLKLNKCSFMKYVNKQCLEICRFQQVGKTSNEHMAESILQCKKRYRWLSITHWSIFIVLQIIK